MTNEQKTKWLAALRSGEYRQGRNQLKQADEDGLRFCCLGVLCEVCPEIQVREHADISDEHGVEPWESYVLHSSRPFADTVLNPHEQQQLCQLNDTGSDFMAIADVIERKIAPVDNAQLLGEEE